jgi:hypothetical protein
VFGATVELPPPDLLTSDGRRFKIQEVCESRLLLKRLFD